MIKVTERFPWNVNVKLGKGTIHKRRRHFFKLIKKTCLQFFRLSIGKFQENVNPFHTPNWWRLLWTTPESIKSVRHFWIIFETYMYLSSFSDRIWSTFFVQFLGLFSDLPTLKLDVIYGCSVIGLLEKRSKQKHCHDFLLSLKFGGKVTFKFMWIL